MERSLGFGYTSRGKTEMYNTVIDSGFSIFVVLILRLSSLCTARDMLRVVVVPQLENPRPETTAVEQKLPPTSVLPFIADALIDLSFPGQVPAGQ